MVHCKLVDAALGERASELIDAALCALVGEQIRDELGAAVGAAFGHFCNALVNAALGALAGEQVGGALGALTVEALDAPVKVGGHVCACRSGVHQNKTLDRRRKNQARGRHRGGKKTRKGHRRGEADRGREGDRDTVL